MTSSCMEGAQRRAEQPLDLRPNRHGELADLSSRGG